MYLDIDYQVRRYIQNLMKIAQYEYSKETKSWCAYIVEFPGIYAQKNTVEETRQELEEMLKEYILINLAKGLPLPGFDRFSEIKSEIKKYAHIKSYQPARAYSQAKAS